jgi:hypothetical protein
VIFGDRADTGLDGSSLDLGVGFKELFGSGSDMLGVVGGNLKSAGSGRVVFLLGLREGSTVPRGLDAPEPGRLRRRFRLFSTLRFPAPVGEGYPTKEFVGTGFRRPIPYIRPIQINTEFSCNGYFLPGECRSSEPADLFGRA